MMPGCFRASEALASAEEVEHQFDRDFAIQAQLASPIDDPHSTTGNFIQQFIVPEMADLAERRRKIWRNGKLHAEGDLA